MSRNYFNRPIQGGGRDAHDYGRTHLHAEPARSRWGIPLAFILGGLIWVAVAAIAIEALAPQPQPVVLENRS